MSQPHTSNDSRSPQANVLIAVVIAVALACLIVPAIVAARASSREMECANNIRQIALGAVTYSGAHNRFPEGTIPNEQAAPDTRLSWDVEVWPYIEATHIQFDREKPWNVPDNLTLEGTMYGGPTYFRCPNLEPAIKYGNLVQTSYVGPSGAGQESLVSAETRRRDGIWGYDRSTAIDQICDGLENTMLLIETSVNNGPWTAGGPPTVREINETDSPPLGLGRQFGGLHAGITNVAFADGSMKPLNDDVDMRVLVELVGVCDEKK